MIVLQSFQARENLNKRRQPPGAFREAPLNTAEIQVNNEQTGETKHPRSSALVDINTSRTPRVIENVHNDSEGNWKPVNTRELGPLNRARGSGRNTFGIDIDEIRRVRRNTVIYIGLGFLLVLLVSIPVIVIIAVK